MEYSFERHRIIGGIGADEQFWAGLEEGAFQLPQCSSCGKWTWPEHFRCGECGSWEFKWTKIEPKGVIFSWTRSWYAFDRVKERADDIPYVTALVEIPEADNVRVLGVLTGDETGLKIGAKVTGSIDPPSPKSKHYPSVRWAIDR